MRRLHAVSILLVAAAALVLAIGYLLHRLSPSSWAELDRRVTLSVSEQLVRISASQGDKLELATVETVETFKDSDSLNLGWLDLGTTTAEVRVPVVYRFHIALAEGLKVEVTRHGDLARCVVHAPKLRPTLPPAIRTEGIEKKASSGWGRFNGGDRLAELEKGLTTELILRAPAKAELARDKARTAVAGFVSRWLMDGDLWGGPAGIREIVVLFPGETDASAAPTLTVP